MAKPVALRQSQGETVWLYRLKLKLKTAAALLLRSTERKS
jgi:hypothetical protein